MVLFVSTRRSFVQTRRRGPLNCRRVHRHYSSNFHVRHGTFAPGGTLTPQLNHVVFTNLGPLARRALFPRLKRPHSVMCRRALGRCSAREIADRGPEDRLDHFRCPARDQGLEVGQAAGDDVDACLDDAPADEIDRCPGAVVECRGLVKDGGAYNGCHNAA